MAWHKANPWRADTAVFEAETKKLMKGWGIKATGYKSVIDAGAGPRLRSTYFKRSKLYAIEPLAEAFKRELSWCDLDKASAVYAVPLEQYIPDLRAEFLICINVLDHCQDFDKAVANLSRYADTLFLSYDCGEPDPMHPLHLNEVVSEMSFMQYGLKVDKFEIGDPYRAGYSMNYWLSK